MSDPTISSTKASARSRLMRPERIDIGVDELVRNDLIAKEQGASERAINRGDAEGAPYTYVAGVKYRPVKAYQQYLASRIKRRNPPPSRRRGRPAV